MKGGRMRITSKQLTDQQAPRAPLGGPGAAGPGAATGVSRLARKPARRRGIVDRMGLASVVRQQASTK
eukprot:5826484-Pyramimonas_sp.AAC.1